MLKVIGWQFNQHKLEQPHVHDSEINKQYCHGVYLVLFDSKRALGGPIDSKNRMRTRGNQWSVSLVDGALTMGERCQLHAETIPPVHTHTHTHCTPTHDKRIS